jgi:hypothetical protein
MNEFLEKKKPPLYSNCYSESDWETDDKKEDNGFNIELSKSSLLVLEVQQTLSIINQKKKEIQDTFRSIEIKKRELDMLFREIDKKKYRTKSLISDNVQNVEREKEC